MEGSGCLPPEMDASRPSLDFPLGTALVLIIIFSLSGIFSCCYHWDKLKSLCRRSLSDHHSDLAESRLNPSRVKCLPTYTSMKQNGVESLRPVLMPGDTIAKFIAMPCPCETPRLEKIAVEITKSLK